VQDDRREALHAAFVGLGLVREGKRYDFETARGLMRSFYGPMLRDETLAVEPGAARGFRDLVASKRELLKLTLPGELLFLFRIRFGLMSILARLGARANWYQLERSFGSRVASGLKLASRHLATSGTANRQGAKNAKKHSGIRIRNPLCSLAAFGALAVQPSGGRREK
jgi:hypothetical protein